jgi:hypothetical protein
MSEGSSQVAGLQQEQLQAVSGRFSLAGRLAPTSSAEFRQIQLSAIPASSFARNSASRLPLRPSVPPCLPELDQ